MRKLIIGISAVVIVVLMFWIYAMVMDTTPIETPKTAEIQDFDIPGEGQDQGSDPVKRTLKKTDYYKYDPVTKEIQAVYGFDKLLNPGTEASRWLVENPYLQLYRSSYECRIESDTGTFQMETEGSNTSPRDAQLNGNVQIHIMPETGGKMSETFIEMDDLTFSSERSEFATEGPVTIRSDQILLEGVGMVMLVDTATGRVDFMQIRDLTELRIYETVSSDTGSESEQTSTTPAKTDATSSSQATQASADASGNDSQQKSNTPSPTDYYQCILEDNVEITYGNELIVDSADEVTIQNILLSQERQSSESQTDSDTKPAQTADTQTPRQADTPTTESSVQETTEGQPVESRREVVVRCDGGIIFKPMDSDNRTGGSDAFNSELSVAMSGNPLQIARIVSNEQPGRELLASCGLLTYTPMEDILRLFTDEQQPQIVLNAQQSQGRIETEGNVWWNRKDQLANIAGPGKMFFAGSDAASEPTEVMFKGAMDVVFASSIDRNVSPTIQNVNLTGGMQANFKQDGWYQTVADSAFLEFGSENELSQAQLHGKVRFESMDPEKPQLAAADSATFKFGPQNSLQSAYMDGGVMFESSRNDEMSRALSETATFYFDQDKIQTADLDGAVSFLSETGKLTSSHATIEFKPDETGSMQPKNVYTSGEAALETIPETQDSPPARFKARKIDYDVQTGSGLAHGPINFMFYQPADTNSTTTDPWIPVIVTADDNARFIADATGTMKQVVFNGNVLASRHQDKLDFEQQDDLHGEKLIVDLDKGYVDSMEISTITMTGGDVYAQSQRIKDDEILSNVKLFCSEIVFNQTDDQIVAEGPGEIQMDNSKGGGSSASSNGAGVDFSKPCYVFIKGFDSINWDLNQETIVTDGQQDQLRLVYVPLLNGAPEKYVYVDSMRFDLSFGADTTGQTVLKRVFTDRGIVYIEKDRNNDKTVHTIIGNTFDYNAIDGNGWVKIEGTPAAPVNVDGLRTPFVYVHPITGQLKTSLSTTPGVLRNRQPIE